MPIDFFSTPCDNDRGNCQTEGIHCTIPITKELFGISDANANSRVPAKVLLDEEYPYDLTIKNPTGSPICYKAIDYCVDIFRTGIYDITNDNRDVRDFSSSNSVSTSGRRELIKRCEGMLYEEGKWILFFEIKNRRNRNWLIDARRKFEETILSFNEHHPDLKSLIIEPIVSNKSFFGVHQNEMIQKKILKDKIGVAFKVQDYFKVDESINS